jgi:hypothetical protein
MYLAKNGLTLVDSIPNTNKVHHFNSFLKNQHVKHMHMIKQKFENIHVFWTTLSNCCF